MGGEHNLFLFGCILVMLLSGVLLHLVAAADQAVLEALGEEHPTRREQHLAEELAQQRTQYQTLAQEFAQLQQETEALKQDRAAQELQATKQLQHTHELSEALALQQAKSAELQQECLQLQQELIAQKQEVAAQGLKTMEHFQQEQDWGEELTRQRAESEALRQECLRLQQELEAQTGQVAEQVQRTTFEHLQTLLINYPSVQKVAHLKPTFPAKNLVALFTSLDTLLKHWNYEPIGKVFEQVPFDAQLHQPDEFSIQPGEPVYVRFVGYRQGEKILCPAKVSRNLPGGFQH